jgi:hypothetical protein
LVPFCPGHNVNLIFIPLLSPPPSSQYHPLENRILLLLTFSVVTVVIGVRAAINRRASELRRMNPA